ncbi:hypothetical protein ABTH88_23160, partial [Acinetobacter baumannii]
MNERSTSRRVWDYRQPYSAEDRADPRGSRQGGRHAEYAEDDARRGRGIGRRDEEPVGDNPYGTYPSTGA